MLGKRSPPQGEAFSDEKAPSQHNVDVEAAPPPHGWAQWFGGPNTTVGPRIGPVLENITVAVEDSDDSASAILHRQKEHEQGAQIQYRSCSWQMVCATLPLASLLHLLRCFIHAPSPLCAGC